MPYLDTEWAVVVEGALPSSEVWANRWTVQEQTLSPDQAALTTAIRGFYLVWAGICANDWTATMLTYRNLVTSDVVTPTWAVVQGDEETANPLPTECAIRISLSAANGRRGGPFMSGLHVGVVDTDGRAKSAEITPMASGLADLFDQADAAGYAFRLDSPTDTGTNALTAARIGRTFDVIRRRRNQVPEAYVPVTLP